VNGPSRFEARWLKEEGCDEVVEKAWKDSWGMSSVCRLHLNR
jgi:hypothetical protein